MRIVFKNLEKSELIRTIAEERLESVFRRFPDLVSQQVSITVSMENSPFQAGPDVFTVKFHCRGGRYRGILLEKSAPTLYQALADIVGHLLERLNRHGDKVRIKKIRAARAADIRGLPTRAWDFDEESEAHSA